MDHVKEYFCIIYFSTVITLMPVKVAQMTKAVMKTKMEELDDKQLAEITYVLQQRMLAGEKNVRRTWARFEQEVQRRANTKPANQGASLLDQKNQDPWWKFW